MGKTLGTPVSDGEPKGFDEALELLCCLPRYPAAAALTELAVDLGYEDDRPITTLLSALKRKGYLVHRFTKDEKHFACIERVGWPYASRDARRYWARVHGT